MRGAPRPAWLLALVAGAAAIVLLLDVRSTVRRQLEASGVALDAQREAADGQAAEAAPQAGDGAPAGDALERAGREAELEEQLAAGREQLEAAVAERDRALADLAAAGAEAESLRGRVAALESEQVSEQARFDEERARKDDEKLQLIADNSRLLDQVLDRDRRLEILNRSLGELRERADEGERGPGVVTTSRGEGLASRASDALRRSGAGHAVILEGRLGEDGALADLLVRLAEAEQPARLVAAERGVLSAARGRAALRLEGLSGDVGEAGAEALEIDLPSFDAAAWIALGLQPPGPFRAVGDVSSVLAGLLERQGWQLEALQGVDGEMLHGLELSQVEPGGQVLRTLRAARGTLAAGPELTLWDGTVTTGADERPFFGGIFRLPLPGLDAAAWRLALAPSAP